MVVMMMVVGGQGHLQAIGVCGGAQGRALELGRRHAQGEHVMLEELQPAGVVDDG